MIKTESMIVKEVCQWLSEHRYFFWRVNNIPVYGRALNKYTPKGLPDIMAVFNGHFLAIEVKRQEAKIAREPNGRRVRGGKLRPEQQEWATKCALNGGDFFLVHSAQELEAKLVHNGFYKKSAIQAAQI